MKLEGERMARSKDMVVDWTKQGVNGSLLLQVRLFIANQVC